MPKRNNDRNLIVLIHPGIVTSEYSYPPVESMFLAVFLEKCGFEVMILDQRVDTTWRQRVEDRLDDILWAGISVITGPKILNAIETSKLLKKLRPDLPVVWGGWHPTFAPEQVIEQPFVDYVVCGIGELKIAALSKHIQDHGISAPLQIPGVLHRDGAQSYTVVREHFDWLECKPAYHLIDIEDYRSPNNIAGIITSRGCPFRCAFCTIAQVGYINRSVSSVVNEIEFLVRDKGFSKVYFMDGLFFAIKRRVMEIIDGCEQRGLTFEWKGSVRGNTLRAWTDDDMRRLKDRGLINIFVGAESGSEAMLARINKQITPDDLLHLADLTGRHGILLSMTFLCGLPHETVEDLEQTIQLIHRILKLNNSVRILNPFYCPIPGSEAYNEMLAIGWLPPAKLEEWATRTKWGASPDEIDRFPWMEKEQFAEYIDVYKRSILYDMKVNAMDRY
jgi:radical SAM superfamily enzyme YgiQ (UPF0313 family)